MSLVSDFVALAADLTQTFELQADVVFWKFGYADGAGKRYYQPAVVRKAIYTSKQKQVRTFSGELTISNAQIVFLDPTVVGAFDKIVVPVAGALDTSEEARDTAQPILGVSAFTDGTNSGILSEIYLGDTSPI